ncbi:MAG: hypothetical protein ABIL91_06700 [candidate division WOR-3 bacterium]|jgi:Trm5-related predicted tRNA methylase
MSEKEKKVERIELCPECGACPEIIIDQEEKRLYSEKERKSLSFLILRGTSL